MIGWFFCFCFRLRQSSFHLSDGVINGIRNGNVLILPTPIPSSLYMTPLVTPIFDFHLVVSSLTTPSTIPTTTPSLVKTSLKGYKSLCPKNTKIFVQNSFFFFCFFLHKEDLQILNSSVFHMELVSPLISSKSWFILLQRPLQYKILS